MGFQQQEGKVFNNLPSRASFSTTFLKIVVEVLVSWDHHCSMRCGWWSSRAYCLYINLASKILMSAE